MVVVNEAAVGVTSRATATAKALKAPLLGSDDNPIAIAVKVDEVGRGGRGSMDGRGGMDSHFSFFGQSLTDRLAELEDARHSDLLVGEGID